MSSTSPPASFRALATYTARALPVAAVLGAAGYLALEARGSIAVSSFASTGVLLALLLAVVLWSGAARRLPKDVLAAAAALAALAVWAASTALWAAVPSLARDEGLLVALGLLALLIPVVTLDTSQVRLVALGLLVAATALAAVVTALELHGGHDLFDVFRYRRLSYPITYANASAGLFLAGFWPAVVLAGRRAAPLWSRVAGSAAASLLLATSILAQSKGGVIGLAASTLVLGAIAPSRLRLLLFATLAAIPVAAAFSPLTAAYGQTSAVAELRDVHRAAIALGVVAVAGALVGAAATLADRRLELDERRRRGVGRAAAAALAAVVLLGAAAFVVAEGNPAHWTSRQWHAFKRAPAATSAPGTTHLLELGSNRYDFWRVAIGEWRRHPVWGDGARSFSVAYLAHGRSSEEPARAHSLPLELLGEEGIVGFGLAAAAYGLLLVGLARRTRRRSASATAALAGCTLLLTQALVDWTFTFPALVLLFFVLAGIGLADDGRQRIPPARRRISAGVAVLLALAAFAPPWLSAKLVQRGLAARSSSDLRWAHRLDPVSIDPWIAEAEIAATPAAALPPLLRAERRAPRSLAVHYLLGSVYYNAGRKQEARRAFEEALRLHPHDAAVERALAVVRG